MLRSWYPAYVAATIARAIDGKKSRKYSRCSFRPRRSDLSAGSHSRRCRRLNASRYEVTHIACVMRAAWCGRKHTAHAARIECRHRSRPMSPRKPPIEMPMLGKANALASPVKTGNAMTKRTITVHASGPPGKRNHPPTSERKHAMGSKLRRRLSSIFHNASAESGLRPAPFAVGTVLLSHGKSCQSPRTQR